MAARISWPLQHRPLIAGLALLASSLGCTGKVDTGSSISAGTNTTFGVSTTAGGSGGEGGSGMLLSTAASETTAGGTAGSTSASGTTGSGGTAATGVDCTTEEVRGIFQASCASSACHDATQPAAQLDLSGADPAGVLLGVASALCDGQVQLVAGDPQASFLWQKLTQVAPECGDPMPIGLPLSSQELACIEQWIVGLESGVPDCETCGTSGCIDVSNDARHCGACAAACEAGHICQQGVCSGCPEGRIPCGAACVDIDTDANHCGACGAACQVGERCVGGQCACAADGTVSFASDIAPWLEASCAGNGCHGGRMAKEGLDLASTASYQELVGTPAEQCSDGRLLVDPGSPGTSYLMHKLTGVDMCSGGLMPKADAAVDEATLAKIATWICSGAPHN